MDHLYDFTVLLATLTVTELNKNNTELNWAE